MPQPAKPSSKTSARSASVESASAKRAVAAKKNTVAKKTAATSRRKAVVRDSTIHGRGVVAARPLKAGERICEYIGERIGWPEALKRHPHDPEQPFHTFYFSLDDDTVIDGNVHGNYAKWINHSCEPNCEAELREATNGKPPRVFISALRDIDAGEELVYNYGLSLDERYTPKLKREFACHCGSPNCTGTMLAPKR